MAARRLILHVDLDAFYASVEELDHPEYRGQPLIVAGLGSRGVVSTCNYVARKFGVRSAMPTARARRLCPDGIYVSPRISRYQELSSEVMAILESASPQIEPLSLDEAFLDLSASQRALGSGQMIASTLQQRIRDQCGLGASFGLAPNKLVAKLASEAAKPGGIREVGAEGIRSFLDPLPLAAMWGVGKVLQARLEALGLQRVEQLLAFGEHRLVSAIGQFGHVLWQRCLGADDRPVESQYVEMVISSEETFDTDINQFEAARSALMQHCERVGQRARARQLRGHRISIKLRRPDFSLATRQTRIEPATADTLEIYHRAETLLQHYWRNTRSPALRLLGVGLADFASGPEQGDLLGPGLVDNPVDTLADAISARFGRGALRHARGLRKEPVTASKDADSNDPDYSARKVRR